MRLADLAASKGYTLSTLTGLLGLDPGLLESIDVQRQPLPRELAARIAQVLKVDVAEVKSGVLNTDLEGGIFYNTVPPAFGPFPPARIFPTQPVQRFPRVAVTEELWLGDNIADTGDFSEPYDPAIEIYTRTVAWSRVGLALAGPSFASFPPYDEATVSGFFAPNEASTVFARATDGEVWAAMELRGSEFDAFAVVRMDNAGTPTGVLDPGETPSSILAKDPQTANVWGAGFATAVRMGISSFTTEAVLNLALTPLVNGETTFTTYVVEMMFVQGSLYLLCGDANFDASSGLGIYQIDPTPGSEAVVQVTPNPSLAKNFPRFTYSSGDDSFYVCQEGDVAGQYYVADRATLTLTPLSVSETTAELDEFGPITLDVLDVVCINGELWFSVLESNDGFGQRSRLLRAPLGGGNATASYAVPWPPDAGVQTLTFHMREQDGLLYVVIFDGFEPTQWFLSVVDPATGVTIDAIPFAQGFAKPTQVYPSMPQFGFMNPLPPPGPP